MRYKPGSFSKNFAWHGTGLGRLHRSTRAGFQSKLLPVDRSRWRQDSGINDPALQLIPVNFFLHNRNGRLSVDELVFQAVDSPHTLRFDRLALFAFHLNRVGRPPGAAVERPAMWANEFVRKILWRSNTWRANALQDEALDHFIDEHMDATDEVRLKCRNNYRHLFELTGSWPTSLPSINSGAEQWISSALFLAWDRFILDGGSSTVSALLDLVRRDELFKLAGVGSELASVQAHQIVDSYLQVGGPKRFSAEAAAGGADAAGADANAAEWLEQEGSDEVVERRTVEVQQQKRNRRAAARLKIHYDNTCMVCGVKLQIAEGQFYSEAAHIRPLGKPHDGPDKSSNMLILWAPRRIALSEA